MVKIVSKAVNPAGGNGKGCSQLCFCVKGTVTQPDGSYSLQAPINAGAILISRAVGYDEIAEANDTGCVA